MACRVEGAPMVDTRDGLFSDWCELNFTESGSGAPFSDLAHDWTEVTETEESTAIEIATASPNLNGAQNIAYTPSIIETYDSF